MGIFHESGNYQPKEQQVATGKKHTIKSRTKATTSFALRQVRDAFVAAMVMSALTNVSSGTMSAGMAANELITTSSFSTIGLIAIGAMSFMGSKMVFKRVKKHIIKKREKAKGRKVSLVADAISVAAPLTALLIGGYAPAAIVGIGVGAITLARKIYSIMKHKKQNEEQEVRTR